MEHDDNLHDDSLLRLLHEPSTCDDYVHLRAHRLQHPRAVHRDHAEYVLVRALWPRGVHSGRVHVSVLRRAARVIGYVFLLRLRTDVFLSSILLLFFENHFLKFSKIFVAESQEI